MMPKSSMQQDGALLEKHLAFYEKNGFCVVNDILSEKECEMFIKEAERMAAKQEVKYVPVMNPHQNSSLLFDLLRNKKIITYLEAFAHSRVSALQSMLYYKPPGQLGRDLHQDNFYAKAERGAYIGTWLAFEDTDQENGGLVVYPGSHKEPLLDVVEDLSKRQTNLADFKNDRGLSCVVPPGYQKVYLARPKGAAVFIHNYLVHGSEANLSKTRFRRVFAGHYIKQGSHFRPGRHAKRKEIDVYL